MQIVCSQKTYGRRVYMELDFSDHLQEALSHLEKANKALNKQSRLSNLDVENVKDITTKIKTTKENLIAVMALHGRVHDACDSFCLTPGRVYQLKTKFTKQSQ